MKAEKFKVGDEAWIIADSPVGFEFLKVHCSTNGISLVSNSGFRSWIENFSLTKSRKRAIAHARKMADKWLSIHARLVEGGK
jgi:hypothetical protein